MSYYAKWCGAILLSRKPTEAEAEMLSSNASRFGADVSDLIVDISAYDNYHDDEWREFLDALTPLTESGEVEFAGEDDCHWRFIYYPERGFVEEYGYICYVG